MKNNEAVTAKTPRNFDEFVKFYGSLFRVHSGELVMKIERDDDDGFRGGPGMNSPLPSTRGTVRNSSFYLALIDWAKGFQEHQLNLYLPVNEALLVHCHGTSMLEGHSLNIGGFDLLHMRETLSDLEIAIRVGKASLRLPKVEFAIGDAEVAKALAMVHTDREFIAIRAASAKLGHLITGAPILDEKIERAIDHATDALLKSMPRSLIEKYDTNAIIELKQDLRRLCIDDAEAIRLGLEKIKTIWSFVLAAAVRPKKK